MRPITEKHSGMKYPLDEILGYKGNVRLLRTLLHNVDDVPLSAPDAARLAGLTIQGTRKTLYKLITCGVIEKIGSGRATAYGVRRSAPLAGAIRSLFASEGQRYHNIKSSLQDALTKIPEITSAWLNEPTGDMGKPIELNVVTDAKTIGWISGELRTRIGPIEHEYDLIIELALFTRADSPPRQPSAVYLVSPETSLKTDSGRPAQSHLDKEKRARAIARQIGDMIRQDPSLITRARHHINRLLQEGQGAATRDLLEWQQILDSYHTERIRQLLISDTSRANRLRQSSPFFAVLDTNERESVLDALEGRL